MIPVLLALALAGPPSSVVGPLFDAVLTAPPAALDRHGDPLPTHAVARYGWVRLAHGGYVREVRFVDTPDGRVIESRGTDDQRIRWSLKNGRELSREPAPSPSPSLRLTGPAKKYRAISAYNDGVHLHDGKTKRLLKHPPNHWPEALAFDADSTRLAVGHGNDVYLWDVKSAERIGFLTGHSAGVEGVAFLPRNAASGGKTPDRVVSGARDKTVRIWHLDEGTHVVHEVGMSVFSVATSPNGRYVAAGGGEGVVLWDLSENRKLRPLTGYISVSALAFSADSTLLASGSEDHFVRVYDLPSGDSRFPRRELCRWVEDISITTDGSAFLLGCFDKSIRRVRLSDAGPVATVASAREDADRLEAIGDGDVIAGGAIYGTTRYRLKQPPLRYSNDDVDSGEHFVVLPARDRLITDCFGDLCLWRLSDAKHLKSAKSGHDDMLERLVGSPDGTWIAAGGDDGRVSLWDARSLTRRGIARHEPDDDSMMALAFRGDSKMLASSGTEGDIQLWSVPGFRKLGRWDPEQYAIFDLVWLPDGRTLVGGTGKNNIVLWDAATGKPRHVLTGHRDSVKALALAPDNRLISYSHDTTALVWDLDGITGAR